ncbi:MAG TPA: hypothetical protein VJB11_00340 [archaeon]|nr:hypothetical protein [archaeon]
MKSVEAKPWYPFVTKILIDLFNEDRLSNVRNILIEPVYGFVGRIEYKNSRVHMFRSQNLGVNSLGASEISNDKGYTKFFLNELGYKTPRGEIILMPEYIKKISKTLSKHESVSYKTIEEADNLVSSTFGYPCYAKPNFGSQGRGIKKCEDWNDLKIAINEFREREENILLLEEAINMPDYRIVILKDEMISCYLRKPLYVVGDGISTIGELLRQKQKAYNVQGRDTIIDVEYKGIKNKLGKLNMNLESIPAFNKNVLLLDVSNLSLGGESEDYSNRIHQHWKDLCIKITYEMGLKLCGVDIACSDLGDPQADYSILEVNASPGLDNYASEGKKQAEIVRKLYKKVFNEMINL